jgi:hypothetical protein
MEHRLAENHNCSEAPPRTPLGSWEVKQRKMGKPAKESSVMVSEGDLHVIKKELPTLDLGKKEKEAEFSFLSRKRKGLSHE